MIHAIKMWRAPAGNWVVIFETDGEPVGWWSHDYTTDAEAERELARKVRLAATRWRR